MDGDALHKAAELDAQSTTVTLAQHAAPKICRTRYPKLATLEIDRTRKSMSVLTAPPTSRTPILLVKGAAECVLDRCSAVMGPDGAV